MHQLVSNVHLIADSTFTMRPDDKKVANLSPGRESVRLVSNDLFGDGVYIFDIDHIPLGCGVVRFLFVPSSSASLTQFQWPAAWTTTVKQWPWGGEIDVVEGANSLGNKSIPTVLQSQANTTTHGNLNSVSLHAAPNCYVAAANTSTLTTMTGNLNSADCSGLSPGNVGCSVQIPGPSLGINFNSGGGGVYAMWRDLQKCVQFALQLNT